MSNMFEQASKTGLRFTSDHGTLMSEDLWHIPLETVDAMAICFKKEIVNSGDTESYITKKSTVNPKTVLSLEICKRIIEVRVAELEVAKMAVSKKQRNARIMEIMADKQDGAMQEKSLDELQAMLEED